MSIRFRLFLLLGALVTLLAAAQWWWIRGLTNELVEEIDQVAFFVGSSVASVIVENRIEGEDGEPTFEFRHEMKTQCQGEDCTTEEPKVQVYSWSSADEEGGMKEEHLRVRRLEGEEPGKAPMLRIVTTEDGGEPKMQLIEPKALLVPDSDSEDDSKILTEEHRGIHSLLHLETQGGNRFLRLPGHRVAIPQQGIQEKLESFSRQLLLGTFVFLVVGLLLAAVVAHRVSAPLRQLSVAAHQVGEGALGTQAPVPQSGGEVAQAVTAFNRMSSQLAELDQRARSLQERQHLGEIGEIARSLAHTLRNPLNALGLSVEELAAGGARESGELAESARRQIRRIDHSIRSFLALASQGGGAVAEVDVAGLVQDVALEALQDSPGRVRLHLEGVDSARPLEAVEPELRAVVQALLVNACEASPEGGRVAVQLEEVEPGRLRLEIEDQGPGLSPEVRDRLFTPHLTTKANGSGMGLFLAHRIATGRYGGTLELLDAPEGGVRAVLELEERREDISGGTA